MQELTTHDNRRAQEGLRIADAFDYYAAHHTPAMTGDECGALWFEAMDAAGVESEGNDGIQS